MYLCSKACVHLCKNSAQVLLHTSTNIYSNVCTHVRVCLPHAADREVQRILLELLNQMDGFDQSVNVKVTCCA